MSQSPQIQLRRIQKTLRYLKTQHLHSTRKILQTRLSANKRQPWILSPQQQNQRSPLTRKNPLCRNPLCQTPTKTKRLQNNQQLKQKKSQQKTKAQLLSIKSKSLTMQVPMIHKRMLPHKRMIIAQQRHHNPVSNRLRLQLVNLVRTKRPAVCLQMTIVVLLLQTKITPVRRRSLLLTQLKTHHLVLQSYLLLTQLQTFRLRLLSYLMTLKSKLQPSQSKR